jgi:peptide-methionine (S)-S-oxide reductase
MQRIGFGGGCHWCTEAVFQALIGVARVEQGFIAAPPPNDTLSEAVIVTFDPDTIPLTALIAVHMATHSATSTHGLRHRYRSAIYCTDAAMADAAQTALADLAQQTGARFVTKALQLVRFVRSDPRYHNYYATNPERPFCQTHIDPKLARLRQEFWVWAKPK